MGKRKRTTKANTGSHPPTPEPEAEEVASVDTAPTQLPSTDLAAPAVAPDEPPRSEASNSVQVLNDFALEVATAPASPPGADGLTEPEISTASVCPAFEETEQRNSSTETGCLEANCSGCHVM